MHKFDKHVLVIGYFFAVLILIIGVNFNNWYNLSQDIENHYTLANKIVTDGDANSGYMKSLGGMKDYPPVSHWAAAVIGKIVNSTLLGMNVVIWISFVLSYYIIAYFLLSVNIYAFAFASMSIVLLSLIRRPLPIIGSEIIDNCFYAQFVSQAYLLCMLSILFRYKMKIEVKLLFSISVIVFGFCIHPAVTLVGFGSFVIIIFYEAIQEKGIRKAFIYSAIFVCIMLIGFFLIPFNRTMAVTANHNGWLQFAFFTTSPENITKIGLFLIIAGILYSLFHLWRLLSIDYSNNMKNRAKLFFSAILLSSSGLALIQYVIIDFGFGSPYAVKKYFFILYTSFLMLVSMQCALYFEKYIDSFRVYIFLKRNDLKYVLMPLLAIMVAMFLFPAPVFNTMQIVRWQNVAKNYYLYQSPSLAKHNMIAQLPIPAVLNYMITVGDLEFPRNETAYSVLSNSTSTKDIDDYYVITDNGYSGTGAIFRGGGIAVVPKYEYYSIVIGDNYYIKFDHVSTKRYLKEGFSTPEPWGVWSDGSGSTIELSIPEIILKNNNKIVFELNPWLVDGHSLFYVDVLINNIIVDRWYFDMSKESGIVKREIDILKKIIIKDNIMRIGFRYSNVASPSDLKISIDPRKICLGFVSLKFIH